MCVGGGFPSSVNQKTAFSGKKIPVRKLIFPLSLLFFPVSLSFSGTERATGQIRFFLGETMDVENGNSEKGAESDCTTDALRFYSTRRGKPGAAFSTFSNHPLFYKGKAYPTVEHAFQAQKFEQTDPEWAETIRNCKVASAAKKKGGSRDHPIRRDWNLIKEQVMYDVLQLKALYNEEFVEDLLATGSRTLVEASPSDYFWGIGHHENGENRLGHLLMKLRAEIRADSEGWKKNVQEKIEADQQALSAHTVIRTKDQWEAHLRDAPSSPSRKRKAEEEKDGDDAPMGKPKLE